MSFLKAHINKIKGEKYGKSSWTKRADIQKEEEELINQKYLSLLKPDQDKANPHSDDQISRKRKHDEAFNKSKGLSCLTAFR